MGKAEILILLIAAPGCSVWMMVIVIGTLFYKWQDHITVSWSLKALNMAWGR